MSEEAERPGEKVSQNGGGSAPSVARVLLTPQQVEAVAADIQDAWRKQDAYIDHLETQNKHLEGISDNIGLLGQWFVQCRHGTVTSFVQTWFCLVTFLIDNALTNF